MSTKTTSIFVAIIAVLAASIWDTSTLKRTLPHPIDVYSPAYDVQDISAPSASSWRLRIVARIIVSSPFGDFLARRLLVKNDIPSLVELADAIRHNASDKPNGREFAIGGEPLIRLSDAEQRWHIEAAASEEVAAAERIESYHNGDTSSFHKNGLYNSIYDYHDAYNSSKTSPSKVLTKLLDFINETDAALRCVEYIDPRAETAAARSAQRWKDGKPLGLWDGVPVMVKPEISIKGIPFTSGRRARVDGGSVGTYDDTIVRRFHEAGAVVVGSTVMHEKGVQPTGYNPHYGGPKNPYDLERFTGGSSSGSAVAVATGMVPVAVGFDGGGSIRIPASWSGTVGLAVGYGRIPFGNGKQNLFVVAKSGVLAATVDDSLEALMLLGQPLTEAEGRDKHSYHVPYGGLGPPPPHAKARWADEENDRSIRIGIFSDWVAHRPSGTSAGTTAKDDAVFKVFSETLELLKTHQRTGRRYEVVDFTIPQMHRQALAHGILITAMFSFSSLSELFPGSSRQTPEPDDDYQPATEIQFKLGTQVKALELLACYTIRNFALSQWRSVLAERVDVILTPTTAMTALQRPRGSDKIGFTDIAMFVQMMRFIWPGNLLGLPGLAVPVGSDSHGLPISVQVICTHWHEADCLAVGKDIERIRNHPGPATTPPKGLFVNLLS